jgi:sRNA-binding protein
MKIRTIFHLFLLCIVLNSTACRSSGPGGTAGSVEEAEAQIAKNRREKEKAAKKEMKKAKKAYWKRQSKAARKSVKRNEREQKRIARKKRNRDYNWEDQR